MTKTRLLQAAIAAALFAPTIALAQCESCPAAERASAERLSALRSARQADAREAVAAHKEYWAWALEAQSAFAQGMARERESRLRALGSPIVTIGGSPHKLDQIARATLRGHSAKVMLTPEGRKAAGVASSEQEERALEEIAVSLRRVFADSGAQTRVFGGADAASWNQQQWGGAILGLSFERRPVEERAPRVAADIAERHGPRGLDLWAKLEAAAARAQASDSAFRAASGAPATRWDSLALPEVLPASRLLSEFSRLQAREFGESMDGL